MQGKRTTLGAPRTAALLGSTAALLAACGTSEPPPSPPAVSLDQGGGYVDAGPDPDKERVDGGFAGPDGGVLRDDRFVTKVVSFEPGPCAGYGASELPEIVLGPPVGGGELKGSLDVVSLGVGGEIVVSFEPNAIVDGPGADFLVFENAFFPAGNDTQPVAELGEVSVSEDGVTWKTFPCTPGDAAPYGSCAGWRPVYSAPANGISPFDPDAAGGDPYDLSDVGLAEARFVRIRDMGAGVCEGSSKANTAGFDLDAVAIVNALEP